MIPYFLSVLALLCVFNAAAVACMRRAVTEGDVEPGSPAASPVWILWADVAVVATAVSLAWWV